MGGALDVAGNVHMDGDDRFAPGTDNTQKLNFYCDSVTVKTAVDCVGLQGKRVFFGLDCTNHVPITSNFVQRFGAQQNDSLVSQFVGSAYAMTSHWKHAYGRTYFAWDVLTVAWFLDPSVAAKVEQVAVDVEASVGHPSEVRVYRVPQDGAVNGQHLVGFAFTPDAQRFYETTNYSDTSGTNTRDLSKG